MPATNKEGTQLLMSPHVITRGRALAVVRQESVAEVWRILIEGALPGMERTHVGQLTDLKAMLEAMNVDYATAVAAMLKARPRLGLGDLYVDGRPRDQFPVALV